MDVSLVSFLTCVTLVSGHLPVKPETEEPCTCVPFYTCDDGNVITGGEGLIDVRNVGEDETSTSFSLRSCGMLQVCCDRPLSTTPVITDAPHVPKCGVRNKEGLATRILSDLEDDDTKMGEFPWQAIIMLKEKDVNVYQGGASLISPRLLVTAAHIVNNVNVSCLRVRLGEYDTKSTNEVYKHVDCEVSEVVTHPDLYLPSLLNDIALVVLSRPVTLTNNIDTICLPAHRQQFDGNTCTVTGWGKSAFDSNGTYQNLLKEVDVPVVPRAQCQSQLRDTKLGIFFRLHTSFICAGGEEGKDACKGDGGGPLSCEVDGQYKLAGIVSWGIGCGMQDVPGVYVNVAELVPWLEEEINKRGGL